MMDVQVTELCKIVSFKPLFSGAVPCVLINHFSHLTIVFRQNIEGYGQYFYTVLRFRKYF